MAKKGKAKRKAAAAAATGARATTRRTTSAAAAAAAAASSSLALRALAVVATWNLEHVTAETAALTAQPAVTQVFVVTSDYKGFDYGLCIHGAYVSVEQAADRVRGLCRGSEHYVHHEMRGALDDEDNEKLLEFDRDDGSVSMSIARVDPFDTGYDTYESELKTLEGVLSSAAPLPPASAAELQAVMRAPPATAAALLTANAEVRRTRAGAEVYAVYREYGHGYREEGGTVHGVWRTRAAATAQMLSLLDSDPDSDNEEEDMRFFFGGGGDKSPHIAAVELHM